MNDVGTDTYLDAWGGWSEEWQWAVCPDMEVRSTVIDGVVWCIAQGSKMRHAVHDTRSTALGD